MELVDLRTRIAKAGQGNDHVITKTQCRADRKSTKVKTTRGEIFTERSERNIEPIGAKFFMELARYQMDLAQIRSTGVFLLSTEVLGGRASVCIAFDADSRKKDCVCHRRF
jgi:hypothetical protein